MSNGTEHFRGYLIYHDGDRYRFADTHEPTVTTWEKRPCGHCLKHSSADGHDACLGTLPGVRNACCGHGQDAEAYVQFDDGRRLAGLDALQWVSDRNV